MLRHCLGFLALILSAFPLAAAEAPWLGGPWPHERSALPSHPQAVFGRLDNGFRYVVLPNAKPEGRVHLSLDVQVGSLMEEGDEQGLAHYLEHMAFNGSRRFPPGTLIPFLQKHGMSFGGDVNAHTSFAETVYKLDLSSASADDLDQGLLVLRDVADGLSLSPEEVDKERGVILAEKASRDSEKSRAGQRRRQTLFGGSAFTQEPIGVEEVLRSADSGRLRRFYEAWYRPERMVLVVVGEINPAVLRPRIEAAFRDVAPRGPAKAVADWGDPRFDGLRAAYEANAGSELNLSVTAMHPRRHDSDSLSQQRRELRDAVAMRMFQGRLLARASVADAPFVGGRYSVSSAFDLFPTAVLSAACAPARWRQCLAGVEYELRAALDYGFTAGEFEEARRFYAARLKAMLAQAPNRRHKDVATEIIRSVNGDRVFQSEEQARDMLQPMLDDMTLDEAMGAFRESWASGNRLIFASGNADLGENPEDALIRAWTDSGRMAVRPPAQMAENGFPYLPEPATAVTVVGDTARVLPGTELTERTIRLANGVTLRLLPTPFERGRLSVSLLFGRGAAALDELEHTIALAAVATLREGGVGRLSREDNRRLFTGRKLSVEEGLRDDAGVIAAEGDREDQDMVLRALWTQFQDPTVGEDARQRLLTKLALGRHDRLDTVDGVAPEAVEQFLYGGARRSSQLDEEQAAGVSLEEMRAFLERSHRQGPRTLVAVGDFDPDALAALAGRLFGSSDAAAAPEPVRPGVAFPAGRSVTRTVADPLDKASLVLAWRADLPDEGDRRGLAVRQLLAAAVNDRLRLDLREELGAAYSPSGRYRQDASLGGFGLVLMSVSTQPALLDKVRAATRAAAAALAAEGVPAGTAARLRAPMLAAWENARRRNPLWQRLLEQESLRARPYTRWSAELPALLNGVGDADLSREAGALLAAPPAEIAVISAPRKQARR